VSEMETATEVGLEDLEGSNVRPVVPEGEEQVPSDEVIEGEAAEDVELLEGAAVPRGLSREGAAFVARFEGCILKLYDDPAGHCTIGVGHLVHHGRCNGSEPAEFRRGITRERAFALLQQDAAVAAAAIRQYVKVPLNQQQFDALCSFGFNCGAGAIKTATLTRRLNAREYAAVPSELNRWVKAGGKTLPGLVKRRRAEGKLFAQGNYR
jgi:lysozyme